ncbi:response regulator [Clostridium sp.]|uniref:response regulator n=1 Tax=Clostridium sp. TaxID=1506 RepID=UPI003D6D7982
MDNKKILIIEDEKAIAELICYGLKKEGFEPYITNDGQTAFRILKDFKPDLVLLDLMLPDIGGLDVCKEITRTYNIPIIILTAKSDITDKILGLEFGADDYITKPFDLREVITRIRVVFRRIENMKLPVDDASKEFVDLGFDVQLSLDEHRVRKSDTDIELTPKEYNLLVTLFENKGVVLSREQILNSVWGYSYVGDTRTVDIHVQRLRKKLNCQFIIETVFGFGYKMIK